jgi:hypothetical protein
MPKLFVTDTNSIISYFNDVFEEVPILSKKATNVIHQAFKDSDSDIRLSIPSVVFIEIFEGWFQTEEFARRFHYEVALTIEQASNVEIRGLDREVLEKLLEIGGSLASHDINDKLILASAIALQCPLISTDTSIIKYVAETGAIPDVLS